MLLFAHAFIIDASLALCNSKENDSKNISCLDVSNHLSLDNVSHYDVKSESKYVYNSLLSRRHPLDEFVIR